MNAGKLTLAGIVVVVVAAVVAGLYISGSPLEQRMMREDSRRVADLRRLSRAIENYYRGTEMLPSDLDTLLNGWASSEIPRDPETDRDYEYEIRSDQTYQLCATFSLDSRPATQSEFWTHAGGHQCFSFDYSALVLD